MRNLLLSIAVIAGLILPIGSLTAKAPPQSSPPARTARPLPGPSARVPVGATGVCTDGARRPVQQMRRRSRGYSLRPPQASALLRLPVALVKFG